MTSPRAWLVLLSCAALLTASASYAGSAAGAEGNRAGADLAGPHGAASGPTAVTVFLRPPSPAALAALSAQPITDRAQRLRQLASLVPTPAGHREVVAALDDAGFDVTGQSTWSVTATARASVVADTFGTRATATAGSTAAQVRAAAGPLSEVPPALSGLVSAAYPTTGGPAPFQHHATGALAGADARNADTPAGVAPSTGQNDSSETIATLQLSQFNRSDLTNYATSHGLPDPVASGQYQSVNVDGGSTVTTGAVEVDLDQQSLLSTAPTARQVAYFAPNTSAGFNDVFSAVYDDVTGAPGAPKPNPHITAMSVSWGACEATTGAADINTLQPILQSLVAAGVTVFAASGDHGIYDCNSGTTAGVDFPASSPAVVAVGGTNLSAGVSAPNTGTNWTETAWSCTSASTCESTTGGGTGGGASLAFAKPSYQSTYVTTTPFAGSTRRLVPDIAAAGDPATGFQISYGGTAVQVGGTSLSAPLSAAQFANLLCDHGVNTGVGDIHTGLYQAYAATRSLAATDPARAFRDVTVGSNGASANASANTSVNAAPGYDTTTGLGGVLWSALAAYLPAVASGTVACPATAAPPAPAPPAGSVATAAKLKLRMVGHGAHRHAVVVATWSTTATGSTVAGVRVRLSRGGHTRYTGTRPTGTVRVRARTGRYTLVVTGTDDQGHSVTTTRRVRVKRHHPAG